MDGFFLLPDRSRHPLPVTPLQSAGPQPSSPLPGGSLLSRYQIGRGQLAEMDEPRAIIATAVLTLRRAGVADVEVLAALGRRTFSETFAHLYSSDDLEYFLDESHSPDAYRRLVEDERYLVFLAEEDEQALGYGVAGPCGLPVPDLETHAGEIKRLYVLASAQGKRIGSRLFERIVADLEQRGHDPLYLSVWSENVGAQRLYGRYGFVKCGEYGFPVGKQIDREFIFRRFPRSRRS